MLNIHQRFAQNRFMERNDLSLLSKAIYPPLVSYSISEVLQPPTNDVIL